MTRARNLANLGNKNALTADVGLFNIGIGSTQPTSYKLEVVGGNAYVGGGVTITGNLSVGGTVTYEDVTNVDSVGIITAAKGFRATAGGVVVTAGVSTFPVVAVSAGTTTKDLLVTGVSTFSGATTLSSTLTAAGNINANGNIVGDNSTNITGISAITASGAVATGALTVTGSTNVNSGHVNVDAGYSFQWGDSFERIEQSDGAIEFFTNNSEKMRLAGSNLGIGTTNPSWEVHAHKASGTAQIAAKNVGGNATFYAEASSGNTAKITLMQSGVSSYDLRTGSDDALQMYRDSSELLRIDSSGRLLLGTTTEGHANADDLTISGSGNQGITIRAGSTSTANIFFSDATSGTGEYEGMLYYDHNANSMAFATAQNTRITIDSSGRVLIGTGTSKSVGSGQYAKLNVEGGVGTTENFTSFSRAEAASAMSADDEVANLTFNDSAGYEFARIQVLCDAAPGATDTPGRIVFKTTTDGASSSTNRLTIDSSGRLLLGAGAISLPKGSGAGSFDLDNGSITMCIGGNVNSTGRTNSTDKINRITSPHYTNAEEPVMLISSYNQSGSNGITYGGGSSLTNAATQHAFYTAANNTTTNGTERVKITSAGLVNIGGAAVSQSRTVNIGSNAEANLAIETHNDATSETANIRFYKSGNTGASPQVVETDDNIAQLIAYGHDGTDYANAAASIKMSVDGAPGGNDMPGKIIFSTNAGGTSTSERMRINSTGRVLIGTGAVSAATNLVAQGGLQVSTNGASGAPTLCLGADGTGANTQSITDNTVKDARIGFPNYDIDEEPLTLINGFVGDGSSIDGSGGARVYIGGGTSYLNAVNQIRFYTTTGNQNTVTGDERMRISSAGHVLIYKTSADTSTAGHELRSGANAQHIIGKSATGTVNGIYFHHNSTYVGGLNYSDTATSLATSSDYRIKENVVAVPNAITRTKQLNPVQFNFIAEPDATVEGFIAHELGEVVPEACFGEKDAVDDDGNIKPQSAAQDKVIPLLTAALQEAIAKIETLETKVAALES